MKVGTRSSYLHLRLLTKSPLHSVSRLQIADAVLKANKCDHPCLCTNSITPINTLESPVTQSLLTRVGATFARPCPVG